MGISIVSPIKLKLIYELCILTLYLNTINSRDQKKDWDIDNFEFSEFDYI